MPDLWQVIYHEGIILRNMSLNADLIGVVEIYCKIQTCLDWLGHHFGTI